MGDNIAKTNKAIITAITSLARLPAPILFKSIAVLNANLLNILVFVIAYFTF
jgi:hypothetical protein